MSGREKSGLNQAVADLCPAPPLMETCVDLTHSLKVYGPQKLSDGRQYQIAVKEGIRVTETW